MNGQDAVNILTEFFSETVASMSDTFNSHQFIRKLSQKHQKEYIETLYLYREKQNPFKSLHGDIMTKLGASGLVDETDQRENSKDIFGTPQQVPVWKKR